VKTPGPGTHGWRSRAHQLIAYMLRWLYNELLHPLKLVFP